MTILNVIGKGKAVEQGLQFNDKMTKYLGDADRGRQRLYTHGGREHR